MMRRKCSTEKEKTIIFIQTFSKSSHSVSSRRLSFAAAGRKETQPGEKIGKCICREGSLELNLQRNPLLINLSFSLTFPLSFCFIKSWSFPPSGGWRHGQRSWGNLISLWIILEKCIFHRVMQILLFLHDLVRHFLVRREANEWKPSCWHKS